MEFEIEKNIKIHSHQCFDKLGPGAGKKLFTHLKAALGGVQLFSQGQGRQLVIEIKGDNHWRLGMAHH
jgi:hypothetical protein